MGASKYIMGGLWFHPGAPSALAITPHSSTFLQNPCLWRTTFPQSVQKYLVSSGNPSGTVFNSDLELAGTVAHDVIIASTVPVAHLTTLNLYDNNPDVSWCTKGRTTTTGPTLYLLRVSALHQRCFRYKPEIFHILGTDNSMAKNCSGLWYLYDSQLLSYSNLTYTQTACCKMIHLFPKMSFAIISSLKRKWSKP